MLKMVPYQVKRKRYAVPFRMAILLLLLMLPIKAGQKWEDCLSTPKSGSFSLSKYGMKTMVSSGNLIRNSTTGQIGESGESQESFFQLINKLNKI
jgi:hypothetical protein